MRKEEGLNVSIGKNSEPVIIECGGEKVEIRVSKRSSPGSRQLNLRAEKSVHIAMPHTIDKLKGIIQSLRERFEEIAYHATDIDTVALEQGHRKTALKALEESK